MIFLFHHQISPYYSFILYNRPHITYLISKTPYSLETSKRSKSTRDGTPVANKLNGPNWSTPNLEKDILLMPSSSGSLKETAQKDSHKLPMKNSSIKTTNNTSPSSFQRPSSNNNAKDDLVFTPTDSTTDLCKSLREPFKYSFMNRLNSYLTVSLAANYSNANFFIQKGTG